MPTGWTLFRTGMLGQIRPPSATKIGKFPAMVNTSQSPRCVGFMPWARFFATVILSVAWFQHVILLAQYFDEEA